MQPSSFAILGEGDKSGHDMRKRKRRAAKSFSLVKVRKRGDDGGRRRRRRGKGGHKVRSTYARSTSQPGWRDFTAVLTPPFLSKVNPVRKSSGRWKLSLHFLGSLPPHLFRAVGERGGGGTPKNCRLFLAAAVASTALPRKRAEKKVVYLLSGTTFLPPHFPAICLFRSFAAVPNSPLELEGRGSQG